MPTRGKRKMDANDVADAEDEWEVDADSLRGDESCLLTEDVLVSLRNDFRKQAEKRMETIHKDDEAFQQDMTSMFRRMRLNYPRKLLNSSAMGLIFPLEDIVQITKAKKQTKKDSLLESYDAEIERVKDETKKTTRSTVKKAKAPSSKVEPPSSSVRRSARKRTAPDRLDMATPSGRGIAKARSLLITPKFDMSTPLPRTAMRAPKPNETLVSLTGSPVHPVVDASTMLTSKTSRVNRKGARGKKSEESVQIYLGKGKTMVMPIKNDVGSGTSLSLQLGEEEKKRLMVIRSNLDTVLKM